jgi:hypothetical protein
MDCEFKDAVARQKYVFNRIQENMVVGFNWDPKKPKIIGTVIKKPKKFGGRLDIEWNDNTETRIVQAHYGRISFLEQSEIHAAEEAKKVAEEEAKKVKRRKAFYANEMWKKLKTIQHSNDEDDDNEVSSDQQLTNAKQLYERGTETYYFGNDSTKVNEENGRLMIEESARLGFPMAIAECDFLGWNGHTMDVHKAYDDFVKIENESGYHWSQNMLGECYLAGLKATVNGKRKRWICHKSNAKAMDMFKKAAVQGNKCSQQHLSTEKEEKKKKKRKK